MRKLCEVLLKRLLTFEGTVILFLESLRICCVLCESRKLTKITSVARGMRLGACKTGLIPQYFYTDRSKAVLLLWFLTVLAVCVYTLVHLLC